MRNLAKLLRKIVLSPLIGMRWVNALESAAREDYLSASAMLARVNEFFEYNNAEYHLLRAYVNFRLNKSGDAVTDCVTANQLLDRSSRYNEEEKKYLRCYASKVANLTIANMPEENKPMQFDESICEGIDSRQIRQALQLSFPI